LSAEKRTSIGRAIRKRRIALRITIPGLVVLLVAGAVISLAYRSNLEAEIEDAAFAEVQRDYLDTWCSTYGPLDQENVAEFVTWKDKLNREDAAQQWREFGTKHRDYLLGRHNDGIYFEEPSGEKKLVISWIWTEDYSWWDLYETTPEMILIDIEYVFWPMHEVFGNEMNEYGKLRPSC